MIDWGGGGGVYKLMERQGEKGTAGIQQFGRDRGKHQDTSDLREDQSEGCVWGRLGEVCGVQQGGFTGEGCVW